MSLSGGRRELWKKYSRSQITLAVRRQGVISRANLAKTTGISPTWLSRMVDELISEGVLVETGSVASPRGRPTTMLGINPNGAPVAGVWLSPESAEIAIANPVGDLLARRSVPYERCGNSVEETLSAVARAIRKCSESADKDPGSLKGIGVSVAGSVNPLLGVIECMANRRGWEGVPIAQILSEKSGMPVYVENDVRAGALAAQCLNSDTSEGSAIYIYIGTGIGAAIVDDRGIVRGAHNFAALLEFMIIDCERQLPRGGKRGLLEELVTDTAFIRDVWPDNEQSVSDMTMAEHVSLVKRGFALAKSGDMGASAAIQSLTRYLGIAVANAVSLIDPRSVYVCGTLIDTAPNDVIDLVRREALRYIVPEAQGVEIKALANYEEFLLRGAIGLVLWQAYEALEKHGLYVGVE